MTSRKVSIEIADLSLMDDTRDLAARLGAGPPMVNNVGALFADRTETSDGSSRWATNLLSHFLLTEADSVYQDRTERGNPIGGFRVLGLPTANQGTQ